MGGFPNPIGWVIDEVGDMVGGAVTAGFETIVGGLVAWVVDAVVWVVGGVFDFFMSATDPNVQADWFISGTGPYRTTLGIGSALLLLFVLLGIAQGVISGDVGGMLRRIAFELPLSIVGMIGLVTLTQVLVRLTDELSSRVLGNFSADIRSFTTVVVSVGSLGGQQASAFVVFVLGLVTVLAGLVLVAELVVRSALIYIVVAFAPLVFSARLWPATKGASRKLLDLLVALVLSKLVIAIALAVAAAAAVGAGTAGAVTALPTPERFAEDPGGSTAQAVGILLTAAAAFGVSAFSPLLIARLLPLTEAALVAQGVKGGPIRAGHQGMMMANTYQMVSGRRYSQIAQGKTGAAAQHAAPAAGSAPAAGGTATAGTAAAPVVGAVVLAGKAAANAARTGANAATGTAQASAASSNGTPPNGTAPNTTSPSSAPSGGTTPSTPPGAGPTPGSGSGPSGTGGPPEPRRNSGEDPPASPSKRRPGGPDGR